MEGKKTAQEENFKILFPSLARLEKEEHPGSMSKMLFFYMNEGKSEWARAAFASTETEMFRKVASKILK